MPASPQKPAVLHVLEALEGGTLRHVRELLPELAARGYRVALAASPRRNPALARDIARAFAACGIAFHELPMRRAISPLSDLLNAVRLSRLIQTLRPDIIHTHSSKAGFLGRLAAAARGVPVVHTPHAFPFLMEGARATKSLYRFLERLVQPKTAALVALSHEEVLAARALGFPDERIHRIPNGTSYPPLPEPPTAPRQGIGFFGRLSRQKGADILLNAVAGSGIEACLHGRGEEEAALRRQCQRLGISPRVRFMGECAQDEVVARMRGYAAVAVPSRWEGCPYVVLDAFAAGVPVIAAHVGGIPDLIQDGINGVLFPVGNAAALTRAITALLRNPPHGLAAAAHATLAAHTLAAMADKLEVAYEGVLRPGSQ